jgi:NADPH:quinone reductase-like Zn-dependent oxidoreductase
MLALIIGIPLIGLASWSRRPFIRSLKGKHVLITGGSSGIGLAIARRAVAEGALVTLVSRRVSKLSSAVDALLAEFKCGQDRIRFEVNRERSYSLWRKCSSQTLPFALIPPFKPLK